MELLYHMVILFFFKIFIYLFLESGEGREKEREKYQCVVASHVAPTRDLARKPGMCPDWESNWRPFGLQASAQSTEPHQPGLILALKKFSNAVFPLRIQTMYLVVKKKNYRSTKKKTITPKPTTRDPCQHCGLCSYRPSSKH